MKTPKILFSLWVMFIIALACNLPAPTAINTTILATSEPLKLLAPSEFALTSQNLATAIVNLNRMELKFILDAQIAATSAATLDDDLREVAACAMKVAQIATPLGFTMVAQDGGSEAARQIADQYYSIARLGYALVIEAQNLREGLPTGAVLLMDAINTIAEYGARLWNPAATEPSVTGNPFTPQVKDATMVAPVQFLSLDAVAQLKSQLGTGGNLLTWLATSQEFVTKTVNLPEPGAPVANPFDPTLLNTLTTASGQSDADRARQVAAANLAMLTGSPISAPAQIQFAAFKSASIADANQVAAGTVPSFASGKASALSRQATGAEPLANDLYDLDGENPPTLEASTPVTETEPGVTIEITNVRLTSISPPPPAPPKSASFEVDVMWYSSQWGDLGELVIGCTGGKEISVQTALGNARLTATDDEVNDLGFAWVLCWIDEPVSMGLGPIAADSLPVLVGDPVLATQTAAARQTADAQFWGTAMAQYEQTRVALTQQAVADATRRAVGTEVAASQTAEFHATITEIARQTLDARQANIMTLTGTFFATGEVYCVARRFTGTLKITVDFNTGAATGSLTGGGGGQREPMSCNSPDTKVDRSFSFTAPLNGSIDVKSGALSLSGDATGTYEGTVYGPQTTSFNDPITWPLTISGTVVKASRTGNGTVELKWPNYEVTFTGDWSAGE